MISKVRIAEAAAAIARHVSHAVMGAMQLRWRCNSGGGARLKGSLLYSLALHADKRRIACLYTYREFSIETTTLLHHESWCSWTHPCRKDEGSMQGPKRNERSDHGGYLKKETNLERQVKFDDTIV